jgi:hypothetical protein
MATRRVRRIRRAGSKKKQSHHGRKTKHHHKRNHNRITRRQRGGALKEIVRKTYGEGILRVERNAHGIDIVFDPILGEYRIGSGGRYTTLSHLDEFEGRKRYSHALRVLKSIGVKDTVRLSKDVFNKFVDTYCAGYQALEDDDPKNKVTDERIYNEQCVSLREQQELSKSTSNKKYLNCVVVDFEDELVKFTNSNDQSYSQEATQGRTFYFFRHFLIPLYDGKPTILCDLEFDTRPDKTLDFKLTKFNPTTSGGPPVNKRCIFPKLVASLNDSPTRFTNVRNDGDTISGTISVNAMSTDKNAVFDFSTLIYTFRACDFLCEDGDTGMDPATEKLALECLVKVGNDKAGKDRIFTAFARNDEAELRKIFGEYTPSIFATLKQFFLRRFRQSPDKLAAQMSEVTPMGGVARPPPSASSSPSSSSGL